MDTTPQPSFNITAPLTNTVTGVISNGIVALTFNADGSITCYKISHSDIMSLPSGALVAYLALCSKPRVIWSVHR